MNSKEELALWYIENITNIDRIEDLHNTDNDQNRLQEELENIFVEPDVDTTTYVSSLTSRRLFYDSR